MTLIHFDHPMAIEIHFIFHPSYIKSLIMQFGDFFLQHVWIRFYFDNLQYTWKKYFGPCKNLGYP
jgi:hypothetical protein